MTSIGMHKYGDLNKFQAITYLVLWVQFCTIKVLVQQELKFLRRKLKSCVSDCDWKLNA
jgi:hypothetical protein